MKKEPQEKINKGFFKKIWYSINKIEKYPELSAEGVGTAEFDFIHFIRHNPGVTQAKVIEQLKIDKGAAARRAASLESKGYLYRKPNPKDGRSQLSLPQLSLIRLTIRFCHVTFPCFHKF